MSILISNIVSFFSSSQKQSTHGSGPPITETRAVKAFSSIEVSGAIKVNLKLSQKERSVTVTAAENILPLISTVVDGAKLRIFPNEGYSWDTIPVVDISTSEISDISASGSVSMRIEDVDQNALKLSVSGAGSIHAKGKVELADFRVSGAGGIKGTTLEANKLTAKVSGAGSIRAKARSSVSLNVSGAGEIEITGSPKSVQSKKSGSGSIQVS